MNSHRLFFAISARETFAGFSMRLEEMNHGISGIRCVKPDNLHLTCFFVGEVSATYLSPCCRIAERTAGLFPPLVLEFDKISAEGYNSESPSMLWARFKQSDTFTRLHHSLGADVQQLKPSVKIYSNPVPHVTLARIKKRAVPVIESISLKQFYGNSLGLWESVQTGEGVHYTVLESFVFTG